MARRLSWSDVRGGLIACLALGIVVAVVLRFSRVGALRGDTFPLHALVGDARGVSKGSEVWLSGQKIGRITSVHFRPPQTDTLQRIQIDMEVLERYRVALRRDAVAQIRSGGSVIGPPVVYLSAGTSHAAPMQPDDTVRTKPQSDVENAASKFGTAAKEFPVIITNVKVLAAQLSSTEGTVGAFVNGPGLGQLGTAQIRATRLMHRVTAGNGSAARIMGGELSTRAQGVMARADSLRALLASPNSSFGRFRRDSTLARDVADVRDQLTLVRASIEQSRGTAGRAMHDSALASALGQAERELTLLLADIKAHPLRYISF